MRYAMGGSIVSVKKISIFNGRGIAERQGKILRRGRKSLPCLDDHEARIRSNLDTLQLTVPRSNHRTGDWRVINMGMPSPMASYTKLGLVRRPGEGASTDRTNSEAAKVDGLHPRRIEVILNKGNHFLEILLAQDIWITFVYAGHLMLNESEAFLVER
ncbi:hypothetical protein AOQ73_25105 [Bradyrhizobium pachyrhizi]|nr:hypothetical protein AOQ73_25105 [Bradyrhizobium pachyrhizi]